MKSKMNQIRIECELDHFEIRDIDDDGLIASGSFFGSIYERDLFFNKIGKTYVSYDNLLKALKGLLKESPKMVMTSCDGECIDILSYGMARRMAEQAIALAEEE